MKRIALIGAAYILLFSSLSHAQALPRGQYLDKAIDSVKQAEKDAKDAPLKQKLKSASQSLDKARKLQKKSKAGEAIEQVQKGRAILQDIKTALQGESHVLLNNLEQALGSLTEALAELGEEVRQTEIRVGLTIREVMARLHKKNYFWEIIYACENSTGTKWVMVSSLTSRSDQPVLYCPILRGPVVHVMTLEDFKTSAGLTMMWRTCRIDKGEYYVYTWRPKQYCLKFRPSAERQYSFVPNTFFWDDKLIAID